MENVRKDEDTLSPFLEQSLEAISRLLEAQSGYLWLYDGMPNAYRFPYSGNATSDSQSDSLPVSPFRRDASNTATLATFCIIENDDNAVEWEDIRDFLAVQEAHLFVLIPLRAEGEEIGIFVFCFSQMRSFTSTEIAWAEATVRQTALAIHLSRRATENGRAAVLEERNRLAREIHDTLAQSFTGILIQLGVAKRIYPQRHSEAWSLVERVTELARQGLAEARRAIWSLQSTAEVYRDLSSLLLETVAQTSAHTRIPIEVLVDGMPRLLPPEMGLHLLRIAQEALTNALHHSHAGQIKVTLTYDRQEVRMSIQDDGKGFDLGRWEETGGFGLIGMRQRAERIGGNLTITSEPGSGTHAIIAVPLPTDLVEKET